jgi:hypothetical protein
LVWAQHDEQPFGLGAQRLTVAQLGAQDALAAGLADEPTVNVKFCPDRGD